MHIGNKIKSLRTQKGVTQEVFADYLKISAQAVSKWETGVSTPDITMLPDISVFFGVTIDELFEISEENQYERVQEMFYAERQIPQETFEATRRFLIDQIAKDDKNIRAFRMLADLYNHRAHSDHEQAKYYAEKAISLNPEDGESWSAYNEAANAVTGDEWNDNHYEVIEFCKHVLHLHPENIPALMSIVENLFADKMFDEAIPYIEKLGETAKWTQKSRMYSGDIAWMHGDVSEAVRLWNLGVEEHKERWQAYCDRADRMKKVGKVKEAIEDYEYCVSMQKAPRCVDGLISLAQLHEAVGDYEAAINANERIIEITCEEYGVTSGEEIEQPKREIERLTELKNKQPA